jgi:hypothetical protein
VGKHGWVLRDHCHVQASEGVSQMDRGLVGGPDQGLERWTGQNPGHYFVHTCMCVCAHACVCVCVSMQLWVWH